MLLWVSCRTQFLTFLPTYPILLPLDVSPFSLFRRPYIDIVVSPLPVDTSRHFVSSCSFTLGPSCKFSTIAPLFSASFFCLCHTSQVLCLQYIEALQIHHSRHFHLPRLYFLRQTSYCSTLIPWADLQLLGTLLTQRNKPLHFVFKPFFQAPKCYPWYSLSYTFSSPRMHSATFVFLKHFFLCLHVYALFCAKHVKHSLHGYRSCRRHMLVFFYTSCNFPTANALRFVTKSYIRLSLLHTHTTTLYPCCFHLSVLFHEQSASVVSWFGWWMAKPII